MRPTKQPHRSRRDALQMTLRAVYFGNGTRFQLARWLLLTFDVAVVVFFVATTFLPHDRWLIISDYALGAVLLGDLAARWWAVDNRRRFLLRPVVLIDLAVLVSLFAPALTESLAFLRVVRTLRLLRSYHVLRELRRSSRFFVMHEEAIFSAINLAVFVFVVSALVYVLQVRINPAIQNYIDALYFTVTTLTTTGFGDITMTGPAGRILAVLIMIIGVSLFLRLIQTLFRPTKVHFDCPDCGLSRHEPDAVHCKHCGRLLRIPNEGGD